MKKIILLCFSLTLFARDLSLMPDTIPVFGYGEALFNMLDGISTLADSAAPLLKIACIMAILIATVRAVASGRGSPLVSFIKVALMTLVVYHTALKPSKQYSVYDVISNQTFYSNDKKLPLAISYILEMTAKADYILAYYFEKGFTIEPDSRIQDENMKTMLKNGSKFIDNGFAFVPKAVLKMNEFSAENAMYGDNEDTNSFKENIKSFFLNCFLLDGTKTTADLKEAENIIDVLKTSTNSDGLIVEYRYADGTYKSMTCKDFREKHLNTIDIHSLAVKFLEIELGDKDKGVLKAVAGVQQSAHNEQSIRLQNAMIDEAISNACKSFTMGQHSCGFGMAQAKEQMRSQWFISAQLATENLPMIKAIIHMVVAGVSILLAILSVMTLSMRYIQTFLTLNLWLIMWSPIMIIINFFITFKLHQLFIKLSQHHIPLSTIYGNELFTNGIIDAMTYAGSLLWLVPILAYSLASGSSQGFVSFASSLGQSFAQGSMMGARQLQSLAQQTDMKINRAHKYADGSSDISYAKINQDGTKDYGKTVVENGKSTTYEQHEDINGKLGETKVVSTNNSFNIADNAVYGAKVDGVDVKAMQQNVKQLSETYGNKAVDSIMDSKTETEAMKKAESLGFSKQDMEQVSKTYSQTKALQNSIAKSLGTDSSNVQLHSTSNGVEVSVSNKFATEHQLYAGMEAKAKGGFMKIGEITMAGGYKASATWGQDNTESNKKTDEHKIQEQQSILKKFEKQINSSEEVKNAYSELKNEQKALSKTAVNALESNWAKGKVDSHQENYEAGKAYMEAKSASITVSSNTLNEMGTKIVENGGTAEDVKNYYDSIATAASKGDYKTLAKLGDESAVLKEFGGSKEDIAQVSNRLDNRNLEQQYKNGNNDIRQEYKGTKLNKEQHLKVQDPTQEEPKDPKINSSQEQKPDQKIVNSLKDQIVKKMKQEYRNVVSINYSQGKIYGVSDDNKATYTAALNGSIKTMKEEAEKNGRAIDPRALEEAKQELMDTKETMFDKETIRKQIDGSAKYRRH